MTDSDITIIDGSEAGSWIAPELGDRFATIGAWIPRRFAAYVRVLHPARRGPRTVSWREVAEQRGHTVDPLIQWHEIAEGTTNSLSIETDALRGPVPGNLEEGLLRAICEVLGCYTNLQERCVSGFWIGQEWSVTVAVPRGMPDNLRPTVRRTILDRATLAGEGRPSGLLTLSPKRDRQYLVVESAFERIPDLARPGDPDALSPHSPNLLWPRDRTWFLSTEVDMDSTFIGGPTTLIDSLISRSDVEALRVSWDDSVASEESR